MNPRRAVAIAQSTVVLACITAASARAQTQDPTPESSSSSQLTAALFAPMLPDAPSTTIAQPVTPPNPRHKVQTSISMGVNGNFSTESVTNGFTYTGLQKLSTTPGFLATFQQTYRPWLGYSVNFGYTRTTVQSFGTSFIPSPPALPPGPTGSGTHYYRYLPSNVYEGSISYVARMHLNHKLTGFTEAGAGVIAFSPTHHGGDGTASTGSTYVTSVNYRPLGVFGGGLEYHLTPQFGIRGEYRTQMYKFPDYAGQYSRFLTFTAQPTVSLTYTFGAPKTYRR